MTPIAALKPAHDNLVVRDPITRLPLPAEGEDKPLDTYWCRRLAAGDVVMVGRPMHPSKVALKTV